MIRKSVYYAGTTAALSHAKSILTARGVPIASSPGWDTGHLLLDVPSFRPGSSLCNSKALDTLLSSLPRDITVWGGKLDHPALEEYKTVDLLKDEAYLMKNAEITARCAVNLAGPLLDGSWAETPTLIIGWGRIGKYLGILLKQENCPLTIAARSRNDRETLASLGYHAVDIPDIKPVPAQIQLVINTVPAPVLEAQDFRARCIKMDLASQQGIAGEDVIWARGLPGIHAPERSGKLIADTFLRLIKEEKV